MVKVLAQGKTFSEHRANLRKVLLENNIDLYNGGARVINCCGIGTCGSCAIKLEGEISAANWRDKTQRLLPPHSPTRHLRLACQSYILGDVRVTKFDSFLVWTEG